jgi:methylmalonyl-CoA mutase N-terminal domain/subunit
MSAKPEQTRSSNRRSNRSPPTGTFTAVAAPTRRATGLCGDGRFCLRTSSQSTPPPEHERLDRRPDVRHNSIVITDSAPIAGTSAEAAGSIDVPLPLGRRESGEPENSRIQRRSGNSPVRGQGRAVGLPRTYNIRKEARSVVEHKRPRREHVVRSADLTTMLRDLLPSIDADAEEPVDDDGFANVPAFFVAEGERPGEFPFTRGKQESGYRENLWVMGQYSGFATPSETNRRFRDLLQAGQTGLSIALDLPTQMGLDSDASLAADEIGRVGSPIDTVDDLVYLLDGLPFEKVRQIRTSANSIGPIFAAFLLVALEELGVDGKAFRVMLQNDPLKEYSARGTYIFPPRASVKLAVDVIEYFAANMPRWEPIEFCGYHYRDSGTTLVQEVALATLNGLEYLDRAVERGISIETFTPSLFIFLSTSVNFLREAAKIRAARRLWARLLSNRYGVQPSAAAINVFVYTLGSALTAQEPINNIVRVTLETLGAVLGGAQTIATSSYDEALGLPSTEAAKIALRTQQIIAYESGVVDSVDPLGGSPYIEAMTRQIETAVVRYIIRLVEGGGAVEGIESGFIQSEIAASAYRDQLRMENGEKAVIGMNKFRSEASSPVDAFLVPAEMSDIQLRNLRDVRASRSDQAAKEALNGVIEAAQKDRNVIPPLIDAARARVTLGEIVGCLKSVYGEYAESSGKY